MADVNGVILNATLCLLFVITFVLIRFCNRSATWRTHDYVALAALLSFIAEAALHFVAACTTPLHISAGSATPLPIKHRIFHLLISAISLNALTQALTRTAMLLFTKLLTQSRIPLYYLYATPFWFLLSIILILTSCAPTPLSLALPPDTCPRFRLAGIVSYAGDVLLNTSYLLPSWFIFKTLPAPRRIPLSLIPGVLGSVCILGALSRLTIASLGGPPGQGSWIVALVQSASAGAAVAGLGCIWVIERLGRKVRGSCVLGQGKEGGADGGVGALEAVLRGGLGHNNVRSTAGWTRSVICEGTVDGKGGGESVKMGAIVGRKDGMADGIRREERVEVSFEVLSIV